VEAFDGAFVEASNDGQNWITLWDHNGETVADSSWHWEIIDIAVLADLQETVYVRWVMGPSDVSVTYPGWNVDDVQVLAVVPLNAADFNGDGQVDLADHAMISDCLLGPGTGLSVECRCIDLNEDGDVDLRDWAEFQRLFSGS
jgi:hypothetical protein